MLTLALFALATAGQAGASAGEAAPPRYGVDAPRANTFDGVIYAPTPLTVSADNAFRTNMLRLRSEIIAQQQADGGTLTPAHRQRLQARLDRIQLRYAEMRRRADVYAVDATGRSRYSARTRPRYVYPPSTVRRVTAF